MTATDHDAPVSAQAKSARDLEPLRWLREQVLDSTHEFSRVEITNTWEQSAARLIGQVDLPWQQLLLDSCRPLRLRCQLVDCTKSQFVELAGDGARVIARWGTNWISVATTDMGKLLVLQTSPHPTSEWLTPKALKQMLADVGDLDHLECVVIYPEQAIQTPHPGEDFSPLARLWALLKPEGPDIRIVIVFALVIGLLTLATPIAVETLVNTVAFGRFLQPIVILSLMLLTFMAFSGALRALQTFVVEIIQRRLFARVAADVAYRLPRTQAEAMEGQSGRELANRFFDVVIVQKVAAQLLLDGVSLVMMTAIGMAMLAFYHPWLLGFDMLLLGMIAIAVFMLGSGAVKSSIKESKIKYRMAAWLQELAECPTTFRHEGAAELAMERADHLTFEYLAARAKHFRILMRQILFALGMQAVASTVLLGLGGWLVISGELTLGQLVAAELIVAVIVGSFAKLGKHMESFYDLLTSVDKLGELFDLPIERQDGLGVVECALNDDIHLENVGYRTTEGQDVLQDLELMIQPGDRIAIQGPSGSGKSVLLDLFFGLRTASEGRITIGGIETRELRPSILRGYVALVRDCEVFQGSISENVRLGRSHVSSAQVRETLAHVGLLDDVLHMPQQLETQVNHLGFPLTSLQLRRLILARACAGQPRLLLIDGVLDGFSDRDAVELMEWLSSPEQPWILLLVTGREALAAMCTRRLVLK